MAPLPKPPALRRGHGRSSGRRVLSAVENPTIPDLPNYCAWHPAVLAFWKSAWSSPLPQEWDESDRHTVLMAARAMQVAWDEETPSTPRMTAMAECRLLMRECGLTPMSRRSLQIEIERAEEAVDRGQSRRGSRAAVKPPKSTADPRDTLAS